MRIEKSLGKFSERQAQKYLIKGVLSLFPFAILFFTTFPWMPTYVNVGNLEPVRGLLSGICITLSAVYLWVPYSTWKSGSKGERRVLNNLSNKLNDDYLIFNNVLLKDRKGRGDIDHIVVGPTGVFVLETKNNSGKVTFDSYGWRGIAGNPSQQLVSNMFRIKDILKNCKAFDRMNLHVEAILVFSNPNVKLKRSQNPPYCNVIQIGSATDTRLSDYIINGTDFFLPEQIESISDCVRSYIGNLEE